MNVLSAWALDLMVPLCVSAFFVIVLKAERFFNSANFGPLGRKINKTHF